MAGSGPQARLERWLGDLHERGWFDGAISIRAPGGPLLEAAVGLASPEAGTNFELSTPSDTGSVAKSLTAALILALADEGRLDLDDPVAEHLDGFPYPLRVDHLLTHRTGLLAQHDWIWERAGRESDLTNQRILEVLCDQAPPLRYHPGERFAYDNVAFDLAALIASRVTGRSFGDVLAERILGPAGMADAFLRPARFAEWPVSRTVGFRRRGESFEPADQIEGEAFHGASNIQMSARDLRRWATALSSGVLPGTAATGPGFATVLLDDGLPTGINRLSLYRSQQGGTYHYPGVLEGFFALFAFDTPRQLSIGLVSNSSIPQWLRPRLLHDLTVIATGGQPRPVDSLTPPLGRGLIATDQGGHEVAGRGVLELSEQDTELFVHPPGGATYRVFTLDPPEYSYVPGMDAYLSVTQEGDLRWWDGAGEWLERPA